MRFVGLTLCLLASSFAARAESAEERLNALEARVKVLEQALLEAGAKSPAVSVAAPLADHSRPAPHLEGQSAPLSLVKIS
jgi:hypothetical protein